LAAGPPREGYTKYSRETLEQNTSLLHFFVWGCCGLKLLVNVPCFLLEVLGAHGDLDAEIQCALEHAETLIWENEKVEFDMELVSMDRPDDCYSIPMCLTWREVDVPGFFVERMLNLMPSNWDIDIDDFLWAALMMPYVEFVDDLDHYRFPSFQIEGGDIERGVVYALWHRALCFQEKPGWLEVRAYEY